MNNGIRDPYTTCSLLFSSQPFLRRPRFSPAPTPTFPKPAQDVFIETKGFVSYKRNL